MPAKGGRPQLKDAPNWGIEPVPERLRVLGGFDTFLLWTNLGISLLVLVAASYFALSLKQALLATIVGGLIGNAMLALAGMIGADARVPSMVLQRAPLGRRGSLPRDRAERAPVPRLGDLRADRDRDRGGGALGPRVRLPRDLGSGSCCFGVLATVLALLGPVGFVRQFVRKLGIWVVLASILYLALVDPRPRRRLGRCGASRARAARSGSRSTS